MRYTAKTANAYLNRYGLRVEQNKAVAATLTNGQVIGWWNVYGIGENGSEYRLLTNSTLDGAMEQVKWHLLEGRPQTAIALNENSCELASTIETLTDEYSGVGVRFTNGSPTHVLIGDTVASFDGHQESLVCHLELTSVDFYPDPETTNTLPYLSLGYSFQYIGESVTVYTPVGTHFQARDINQAIQVINNGLPGKDTGTVTVYS